MSRSQATEREASRIEIELEAEPSLWQIARECLSGKSLVRALTDLRCRSVSLAGHGLDLGAKSGQSTYLRYLSAAPGTQITGVDLVPRSEGVIQADIERELPVETGSQDFVLAMNVFEHLYQYLTCIQECYRVLRPGGALVGAVPFLKNIHPDPDDYFRFTGSALERIFREAGFNRVSVEPLGFGPVTAGVSQAAPLLMIGPATTVAWVTAMLTDKVLGLLFRNKQTTRAGMYPLGYFFVAGKRPDESARC